MLLCVLRGCQGVVVCAERLQGCCYVFSEVVKVLLCVLRCCKGIAMVL